MRVHQRLPSVVHRSLLGARTPGLWGMQLYRVPGAAAADVAAARKVDASAGPAGCSSPLSPCSCWEGAPPADSLELEPRQEGWKLAGLARCWP
jgi:hypothetical protein